MGGTELFCVGNSVQAIFVIDQTDSGVNGTISCYTQVADYDRVELLVNRLTGESVSSCIIRIQLVIDKILNQIVSFVQLNVNVEGNKD